MADGYNGNHDGGQQVGTHQQEDGRRGEGAAGEDVGADAHAKDEGSDCCASKEMGEARCEHGTY